jgi:hypothetical protein
MCIWAWMYCISKQNTCRYESVKSVHICMYVTVCCLLMQRDMHVHICLYFNATYARHDPAVAVAAAVRSPHGRRAVAAHCRRIANFISDKLAAAGSDRRAAVAR